MLEHDPIAVEILERLPLGFPIRIIRGDTLKPGCEHPGTTGFPPVLVGKVEDQYMLVRRGFADLVSPLGRELQMVGLLGMAEDDAIEAVVVLVVVLIVDLDIDGDGDVNRDDHPLTLRRVDRGRAAPPGSNPLYPIKPGSASASCCT